MSKEFRGCTWNEELSLWEDADGCCHNDKCSVIRSDFNFCACGCPEENLEYIRGGLLLIDRDKTPEGKAELDAALAAPRPASGVGHSPEWSAYCADLRRREREYFGSEKACWFFLYWADSQDLTEHGGGVGASWLTEKGRKLIADIAEALAENDEEERVER